MEVKFKNKYAINAEDGDELVIKESDENLLESSCSLDPNQKSSFDSKQIRASHGSASSRKKMTEDGQVEFR